MEQKKSSEARAAASGSHWAMGGKRVGVYLDLILPLLGVVLLFTDFVVHIDEVFVFSFHLIFTTLAAGAFYWSARGTIVRSVFWVTFVTVVLLNSYFTGDLEAAELTEIPALTALLVLVFMTAQLRLKTLLQLEHEQEQLRKLNLELEERSDALKQHASELARTNTSLKERNEENEMFIYSVSHDLRSPLVNLQGFSQELRMVGEDLQEIFDNESLPPQVRERGLDIVREDMGTAVRFIETGVLRLSNIIDALLRLSRAGRVEYQWNEVDVEPIVDRVVDAMRTTVEEKGVEVVVHELPPAWGDANAVEQIFANLISNAVNYLDKERPGRVEVGAEKPTNGADDDTLNTYYVKDNGVGIPKQHEAKIFQIFQRLQTETQGEGLGLTLVRRMVERHGGEIRVESVEGEGSTFFVQLPASAAGVASDTARQAVTTELYRNL